MRDLLAALGNPQDAYKIFHIAGTKGKGSVSAFLASALQQAGYRTGLYTSPHLQDFTERIQINRVPIPPEKFTELLARMKPAIEACDFISTFEIATALALRKRRRRSWCWRWGWGAGWMQPTWWLHS
jgi:dihydrofolate synthase/folylpolyglutamate synthase